MSQSQHHLSELMLKEGLILDKPSREQVLKECS